MFEFIGLTIMMNGLILAGLYYFRRIIPIRAPVLFIATGISVLFCLLYPFLAYFLSYPAVIYFYVLLVVFGGVLLYFIESFYFSPQTVSGEHAGGVPGSMPAAVDTVWLSTGEYLTGQPGFNACLPDPGKAKADNLPEDSLPEPGMLVGDKENIEGEAILSAGVRAVPFDAVTGAACTIRDAGENTGESGEQDQTCAGGADGTQAIFSSEPRGVEEHIQEGTGAIENDKTGSENALLEVPVVVVPVEESKAEVVEVVLEQVVEKLLDAEQVTETKQPDTEDYTEQHSTDKSFADENLPDKDFLNRVFLDENLPDEDLPDIEEEPDMMKENHLESVRGMETPDRIQPEQTTAAAVSEHAPDGLGLDDVNQLIQLAFNKKKTGDLPGAVGVFMHALRLNPQPRLAMLACLEVSLAYRAIGQRVQAAGVLEMLLSRWGAGLGDKDAEQIKVAIKELKGE